MSWLLLRTCYHVTCAPCSKAMHLISTSFESHASRRRRGRMDIVGEECEDQPTSGCGRPRPVRDRRSTWTRTRALGGLGKLGRLWTGSWMGSSTGCFREIPCLATRDPMSSQQHRLPRTWRGDVANGFGRASCGVAGTPDRLHMGRVMVLSLKQAQAGSSSRDKTGDP